MSALAGSFGKEQRIQAEISLRDLVVDETDAKIEQPTIKELSASTTVALGKNFSPVPKETIFKVVDFRIPELRILNPLLDETPFQVTAGSSRIDLEGVARGTERTSAKLQMKTVGAGVKFSQKSGSVDAPVSAAFGASLIAEARFDREKSEIDVSPVTLQISPFLLDAGGRQISWPFVLSTTHTNLVLDPSRQLSYVNIDGPSLRPVLEALLENGLARWAAKLTLGEGDTKGRVRLERGDGEVEADLLSFTSGRVAVDGAAKVRGKSLTGAFLVIAPILRIGVNLAESEKLVHPTASRAWLQEELNRQGVAHRPPNDGTNQ
jgi:hypothetical protein